MSKEYLDKIIQFISAAFAFVAGLAWNTAIQNLINRYIQSDETLTGQFVYAGVVTVIAVVITVNLAHAHDRLAEKEERAEERRAKHGRKSGR